MNFSSLLAALTQLEGDVVAAVPVATAIAADFAAVYSAAAGLLHPSFTACPADNDCKAACAAACERLSAHHAKCCETKCGSQTVGAIGDGSILKLLLANLPAILAMIMAMIGKTPVVPVPAA